MNNKKFIKDIEFSHKILNQYIEVLEEDKKDNSEKEEYDKLITNIKEYLFFIQEYLKFNEKELSNSILKNKSIQLKPEEKIVFDNMFKMVIELDKLLKERKKNIIEDNIEVTVEDNIEKEIIDEKNIF